MSELRRVTERLDALTGVLRGLDRVIVAWSGGVDSSLLAWVAQDVLGRSGALAVTAVSPSLPSAELDECRELAEAWALRWQTVETDEMDRYAYRVNAKDRCAHCKDALLDALGPLATTESATVVLGVVLDDLGDDRPGQVVAAERGAAFPLVDAGFTKDDVRQVSRHLGLATWDKPAAACLASRIPHGTEVSVSLLGRVERAEAALRELGFGQLGPLRVRHRGAGASIEVAPAEVGRATLELEALTAAVRRAAGYRDVRLDPDGYKVKGGL